MNGPSHTGNRLVYCLSYDDGTDNQGQSYFIVLYLAKP